VVFAVSAAIAALVRAPVYSSAAEAAPYEWKNLDVYIGTTAGGGYDLYARILARYIGEYLPGRPSVTAINRPGAGGLSLMNQMYANGLKDGTDIATLSPGFIIDRVVYGDRSHAQFESDKFNWLGSISDDPNIFTAWKSKGFTFQDVLAGRPMNVGIPGPGGGPFFYSKALNALMGAKLKIISGYPGLAQVMLAVEGGELDGIAGSTWNGLKASRPNWFMSNSADVLVQYTKKRLPDLPNVPTIGEFIKDRQTAEIFDVIEQLDNIKYPVFAPPGVPKDRVAALRQAFDEATADPQMIADAKQMNLPVNPVHGVEMQDMVQRITHPPEAIVKKIQAVYAD
jgi:tripartite-type tricarboxylate transporter receptor subunit TctC